MSPIFFINLDHFISRTHESKHMLVYKLICVLALELRLYDISMGNIVFYHILKMHVMLFVIQWMPLALNEW